MVMDDRTKNINISLRSAMLCRHFSYVLQELYFIFFIIYLDTQRSKMKFLEEGILACCNTAIVHLDRDNPVWYCIPYPEVALLLS